MHTLDKSLILVGHMGSGKTSLGPRLAHALSLPFRDSDKCIEDAAGCSIADIFARHGEAGFRELEYVTLTKLLAGAPAVIAAGGGMFANPACRQSIQQHALSLWLRVSIASLVKRINASLDHTTANPRPLLAGKNLRATLTQLAQTRDPIYATADFVVDNDNCNPNQAVQRALDQLAGYQSATQPVANTG